MGFPKVGGARIIQLICLVVEETNGLGQNLGNTHIFIIPANQPMFPDLVEGNIYGKPSYTIYYVMFICLFIFKIYLYLFIYLIYLHVIYVYIYIHTFI